MDVLQTAKPFDLAVPGSWPGFFGNLYPVHFRGVVHLAGHHGSEVAGEFEKILRHPGIMFSDPAAVMAHLQLARVNSSA